MVYVEGGPDPAVAARATAFSLLALPVCYILSLVDRLAHSHGLLFAVAIASLAGLGFVAHYMVFRGKVQPWYMYFLCVMSWTTCVDIVLALTAEGVIDTGNFYFRGGEPYLALPHGIMIDWWDATVHFACYVYIIACFARSDFRAAKPVALFYVGSIINSLFVFLPGNVTGPFGDRITLSYLLNVPFIFMPIYIAWLVITRSGARSTLRPAISPSRSRAASSSPRRSASKPSPPQLGDGIMRTIIIVSSAAAIAVCFIRVIAVVGSSPNAFVKSWLQMEPFLLDQDTYPRWQAITFFFYIVPYLFVAAFVMAVRAAPPEWLLDLAMLAAGATMQGEFAMVGSALHRTSHVAGRELSPHFLRMLLLNANVALQPALVLAFGRMVRRAKQHSA